MSDYHISSAARRTFLRRGVIAGGAFALAPTLTSLQSRQAQAHGPHGGATALVRWRPCPTKPPDCRCSSCRKDSATSLSAGALTDERAQADARAPDRGRHADQAAPDQRRRPISRWGHDHVGRATLLRLSIAEALGSFLVLDDQLTQSDPARMDWFREVLRTCAEKTQVIVFTCRPEDYLTAAEIDRAPLDGAVCAVDLGGVVERTVAESGRARERAARTPAVASDSDTPGPGAEESTTAAVPERSIGEDRSERDGFRPASSVADLMDALRESLKDDEGDW